MCGRVVETFVSPCQGRQDGAGRGGKMGPGRIAHLVLGAGAEGGVLALVGEQDGVDDVDVAVGALDGGDDLGGDGREMGERYV